MSCVDETGCFEVTWNIENFSVCLFEEDISLGSPIFKTETADGSSYSWWKLYLENGKSPIPSLIVKLEKMKGNSKVSKCELSISSVFGVMKLPQVNGFTADNCCCFTIQKAAIFSEKRHLIHPLIPKDIIILNCKIWHEMIKPGQRSFGSVLQQGHTRFEMNDLKPLIYDQDNLQLTMTEYLYESSNNGTRKYKVLVEIIQSRDGCHSFVKSKLTTSHSYTKMPIAQQGRLTSSTRIWDVFPNFNRESLELEFMVAFETVSLENLPLPSSSKQLEEPQLSSDPTAVASEKVPVFFKTLNDDLLLMYSDKFLSDATLNTEGKSFSAHRNILAARSSVFRAMFEKDHMSEARSGVVDIEDVDSETLDRMLFFLYSDSLKDLQWEEASALYYAADKYAVHPLKKKCADILKAGLAADNACDALVLADKHSEEQLMKCTVNFIRDHDEVLSSAKWEELEDSNPRLTTKVMRELYFKKGKN